MFFKISSSDFKEYYNQKGLEQRVSVGSGANDFDENDMRSLAGKTNARIPALKSDGWVLEFGGDLYWITFNKQIKRMQVCAKGNDAKQKAIAFRDKLVAEHKKKNPSKWLETQKKAQWYKIPGWKWEPTKENVELEEGIGDYVLEVRIWTYGMNKTVMTILKNGKEIWENISHNPKTFSIDMEKANKFLKTIGINPASVPVMKKVNGRMVESFEGTFLAEAPLTFQQRRQRARTLRKYKNKMKQARARKKKRLATKDQLVVRARRMAIQIVRRKLAGKMGEDYKNLSVGQKIMIDKRVETKKALVQRIAKRILPKIRQKEIERFRQMNNKKKES